MQLDREDDFIEQLRLSGAKRSVSAFAEDTAGTEVGSLVGYRIEWRS